MRRILLIAGLTLSSVSLMSCITGWFSGTSAYDANVLTIQTLSLFNQRRQSRLATRTWKGDWYLRRTRLDLVDKTLSNNKPDIIVFQEMMKKQGSSTDSDRQILSAGSLDDYQWLEERVAYYEDTDEEESLGVATNPSVKMPNESAEKDGRHTWKMGTDGYLMFTPVFFEGNPIDVFNIKMPSQIGADYLWYSFIEERIRERLAKNRNCAKRVVVGGYMPGDTGARRFEEFVTAFDLIDVSSGFCQVASGCYTATPMNDMFMATIGDEVPARVDRIFVHGSAIIYRSGRNFTTADSNNRYGKQFGLARIWPTQRFGWLTSVRLARCQSDDFSYNMEPK